MMGKLISQPEVIERLGISKMTLWRWRQAGRFPAAIQISERRIGFDPAEIESWIAQREVPANVSLPYISPTVSTLQDRIARLEALIGVAG